MVVGAGYVGLFSALTLAQRGARVVLLDRGLPGAANAVNAPGGIRQQFGTELNVRLAKLSAPTWEPARVIADVIDGVPAPDGGHRPVDLSRDGNPHRAGSDAGIRTCARTADARIARTPSTIDSSIE